LAAWVRPRGTLDIDFMIQTTAMPEALSKKLEDLGFITAELGHVLR